MTEAMEAEFDTVAEWTAQVAADLDPTTTSRRLPWQREPGGS